MDKDINTVSDNQLTPTMEDYLEAIFNLDKEKKAVRVKDIAKKLGVRMPTVTNMIKTLRDKGMVDYEKYEYLELTVKGSDIGSKIDKRHQILRTFLTDILKIDHIQADKDACKMEHGVSPVTLERIVDFLKFVENRPDDGNDWLGNFDEYRKHGKEKQRAIR
jgi:DtxR family transcriptional regulator, Mn-dependent transcriptional regulator